jgi:hypothetical protein
MKITREYLRSFEPCKDRWNNYLKHYSDFEGSFYEFLCLDKISIKDKHWVINQSHKCPKIQRLQRDYALICADRATFDSTEEIKEYFLLCAFINVSEMFELRDSVEFRTAHRSADWSANRSAELSAHWSADWSANRSAELSADWSTEREIQIEIFKSLLQESDE